VHLKSGVSPRILVVDDELVIRELMERVLRALGCDLTVASTLESGLCALRRFTPDLLITDLHLPDGSGVDIARAFKAIAPRAPVVVITGFLAPDDYLAQATDLNIFSCLHKPFELEMLQQVVARALESATL